MRQLANNVVFRGNGHTEFGMFVVNLNGGSAALEFNDGVSWSVEETFTANKVFRLALDETIDYRFSLAGGALAYGNKMEVVG